MGNFLSAQVNQSKQTSLNDVFQASSQACAASCSNVQSGNIVFLDGTTTGDINFVQSCEADANCMMTQALQSLTDQLLTLKQGNQSEANLFGGGFNVGTVNLNLSEQEIKNQVTQIMSALCTADVTNVQNGNIVYARNSKTGNISFKQDGNAKADCVMQNSATAKAKLAADNTQTNAITAGGIGGIIGLVILIIIIAVIFGVVTKGGKPPGGGMGGGAQAGGQQGNSQGGGGGGMDFSSLMQMYGGGGQGGGSKSAPRKK